MFSSDPVVRVEDATIFQDHNSVLNNISFEIGKGEFVFLVGRTGSGKSSLLKTLYGDLPLRLGDTQVAGFNIREIKPKEVPLLRRKIGIIFQDFQLFPDRTVGENLNFVMKATGWKEGAKTKSRLAEVLMQVGLGSVEKKMPHQLSGGEQQRVVIARALINEPLILIADEPTGNLDPSVSTGILKLFQQINKSGTAVLMATHSYGLIKKFPSRVIKCENGKILDSAVEEFELKSDEGF
ncbi:MAG TPA: ATP-binding cassette domain-containing protein [Cyclobacteriaceae bacterium]|nr:ATP-binding cassette domain-containing protein [Cyclobacteriaceae bacterium]MCB9236710.1 ATP-binding cassette domain-containing protein [Flammeovirgaceae bacterium]MCB0500755.1 ATP-binding cassette domain-containing protein [Cyclobacteriaceae bacterium]MCO5272631.1 ATP-binding cassette domain-containing protein [Cyclobacteriaceae bacterium]MCW5901989.1 ATP-binding cassette domain-containing protein [Cyclobacteriaceae bacterium]